MASDLTVAVLTGGTVFHVHGFDDGVAAEFTFHIQQRTLDIMLSIFFAGGIGSIRLGPVITEQVELFIAFAGGQLLRSGHIGRETKQAAVAVPQPQAHSPWPHHRR